jgi:hypothetical protein
MASVSDGFRALRNQGFFSVVWGAKKKKKTAPQAPQGAREG